MKYNKNIHKKSLSLDQYNTTKIALNEQTTVETTTKQHNIIGCDLTSFATQNPYFNNENNVKKIECGSDEIVLFAFNRFELPDSNDFLTMLNSDDDIIFKIFGSQPVSSKYRVFTTQTENCIPTGEWMTSQSSAITLKFVSDDLISGPGVDIKTTCVSNEDVKHYTWQNRHNLFDKESQCYHCKMRFVHCATSNSNKNVDQCQINAMQQR